MQFLVDTDTESPEGLLVACRTMLLLSIAKGGEAYTLVRSVELQTNVANHQHPAPTAGVKITIPPDDLDPAKIFGGNPLPAADVPAGTPEATPRPLAETPHVGGTGQAPHPVPPAPTMTPANVSLVTTITEGGSQPPVDLSEKDKQGFPWDARIHSDTRKKNADGTWRLRRNLAEGVADAVKAELRLHYPAPTGVAAPASFPAASNVPLPPATDGVLPQAGAGNVPVPPAPAAGAVPTPPAAVIPQPPAASVPLPPGADVGVPNAAQPGVVPVTNFRELMNKVNRSLAAGALTQAQVNEACKESGVEGITALASQPMLVANVDASLNRKMGLA